MPKRTTATLKRRSKPPFRRNEVIAYIRERIVDRRFPAGSQLPTRMEVAKSCGAPPLTVQDAFDALVKDGFVSVEARRGSFVAERPPCHHRIALVFTEYPTNPSWGEFWTRMDHVVRAISAERKLDVEVRHGIRAGTPDCRKLEEDLAANRVAGLIFSSNPHPVAGSPILTQPGIARVVIGASEARPELHGVVMDTQALLEQALDLLQAQGRQRCAFFLPGPYLDRYQPWLLRELQRRGMSTELYLLQAMNASHAHYAKATALMITRITAKDRPDGIYIGDDNLVPGLIDGLNEGGINIKRDVSIVAHANFPLESNVVPNVKRIGFSIPEVIDRALDGILLEISGRSAGYMHAQARCDHELDDSGRPLAT